jgi:hypothetical protein
MDSDPPPRTSDSAAAGSAVDNGEDPYSSDSLYHSSAPLIGACIGLLALVLPVAAVLSDRTQAPASLPRSSHDSSARSRSFDGLTQPSGLAGTGPGEPGGGNPRRQQQ